MNMMDGRLKGRGLMWAIIWIMNESRRTMIRSLRRRRSMRWRRMSVVYSGWPWMPIIWSPYLNISIPVFSDHPMISAFGGSSLTSSLWHSIMESLAGSFSVEKKLDDDDDDKWTVLNPMSHPDPALPVFPPSARPSICPTPANTTQKHSLLSPSSNSIRSQIKKANIENQDVKVNLCAWPLTPPPCDHKSIRRVSQFINATIGLTINS